MNWFILALLAGLFFAGARVLSRAFLRTQGNALAFTAIHDFVAGLVLLPFLFWHLKWPEHSITWVYFAGIVITAFLADWLSFVALKKIDVSLYQIINQVRHIFILIGGLLFFSEKITSIKIFAVVLISLGVIVAIFEKHKITKNGIFITVLSTLFAVGGFLFVKATVVDFSETAAASLELLAIGLLSFSLLGFNPRTIMRELSMQKWGLIISGVLFGGFEVSLFYALKVGEASRVIPVTQSALVFTLIGGIFLLGERTNIVTKIVGTIIIAAGIALMYIV